MRAPAILASTLAAGLLVPASSSAQAGQAGGSILWLLRPAGRLAMEVTANGSLSSSDFLLPNDAYVDVWEIEGRAGASITLDMRSPDFDALLFLVGPGLAETLSDDDGGGRCDARITVRLLEDGIYRVAATVNGSRTTGVYTLHATTDPEPVPQIQCGGPDPEEFTRLPVAGRIAVGDGKSGSLTTNDATLDNGAYAQAWEISGTQGQSVQIRLESDAFDSFLYVLGPGIDGILTDDDSGGDLHAEIAFTFPASGTFRIIVSSVDSGTTGAFRLSVQRQQGEGSGPGIREDGAAMLARVRTAAASGQDHAKVPACP